MKDVCPVCDGADVLVDHPISLLITNILSRLSVQCVRCNIIMQRGKTNDHMAKECLLECKECKESFVGEIKLFQHQTALCPMRPAKCLKEFRSGSYTLRDAAAIKFPSIRCGWSGFASEFDSHSCNVTFIENAVADAVWSLRTALLYNPVDRKVVGQSHWVNAEMLSCTGGGSVHDGTITLNYLDPHIQASVATTFARDDRRVGRYYDVGTMHEHLPDQHSYAVYCEKHAL